MVRVRLAPSPTGAMHIGTARAGLFVWLFAKQHEGKFILRIEDTDKERSKKEYEESIISGLRDLGLEWDEFYRQSERTEIYHEHLVRLVSENKVYPCFCSKEDLDIERAAAEAEKRSVIYSGRCSNISPEEAKKRIEDGEPYTLRFRMPKEKIGFDDMVRGRVEYDGSLIGDIVIAKSYDEPLYNFVVVVDDALMEITHVIRGEDHLSNTPKQIAIFNAFGYEPPNFGHLPLILNADRSKMSKRGGDTALVEFLEKGYMPEALINFLALLSWHPKDDREIFSKEDLIKEFSIERVQKGGSIFDYAKLNWLNRQYISHIISTPDLMTRIERFIPSDWKPTAAMIDSVKTRLDTLAEIKEALALYFEPLSYEGDLLHFKDKKDATIPNLEKILSVIDIADDSSFLSSESVADMLSGVVDPDSKGEYLWPLRVSLSGRKISPGPYEIISAIGKKETVSRIKDAIAKLK
ncbi:MAG: glutamate--tRNA ligase [Candidatus Colwellbacteria bacterium]|nr:glutamate--tRNA ligase [Candidatus Colwellbacteria bacterium]